MRSDEEGEADRTELGAGRLAALARPLWDQESFLTWLHLPWLGSSLDSCIHYLNWQNLLDF